jgi:hypothetical protein
LKALLARKRQFEGPKSCLEYLEGVVGPKEAIRGTEAHTRITQRRCWPEKINLKDRSPHSNNAEALLARKNQFEGPKSCLEYLEGAAGPKGAIREKFDQKSPRMNKQPLVAQKSGAQRTSKETQSRSHPNARGTYL